MHNKHYAVYLNRNNARTLARMSNISYIHILHVSSLIYSYFALREMYSIFYQLIERKNYQGMWKVIKK